MRPRQLIHSSTFRLALMYMALFSISVLLLLGFIYWSTAGYMARQTDSTIEAEISGLAERYRLDGLTGLTSLIAGRVSRAPAGLTVYLLTDSDYRALVGNLNQWPDVPQSEDGWLNFRLEGAEWPAGETHRARAKTFILRGGFRLLVGRDIHDLERTQGIIINTLLWGLAITVLLALAGGSMMTRSMVRRIDGINQTSREIMSGDLSRRIPTQGTDDDFDQLAANLNSMLDQIERLMDGMRQVSDNIAHDLRTPLSRLRNRLEVLAMEGPGSQQWRQFVDAALADADALLATFGALLRIARVESRSARANFTRFDLAELLSDVAELYGPAAEDSDLQFECRVPGTKSISGDRELLFQALANLLDNAIKYTPPGGTVSLTMVPDAGGWALVVADSGPGIPVPAREKVFRRFFRLESSRTTPGSGLGLSLVAAVLALHDMSVRLEDNHPGLRVVMSLPESTA